MDATVAVESPRLLRLIRDLEDGPAGALEAFWHEVAERGTPLTEPIPGEAHQVFLTFLWRAAGPLDNVLLVSDLARGYFWKGFAQGKLIRLPGTGLWFRTFRAPTDARFLYCLSPNDPLVHPDDVRDWEARRATWQPDPLNPHVFVFPADEAFAASRQVARSIVELPDAPTSPWVKRQPDAAAGSVRLHHVDSAILGAERGVWVYTPPGYRADDNPCPLVLLFEVGTT